jgi:hypothetical protein
MDIFADTQVPKWLVDNAKPIDKEQLGNFIGTGLAGLANAFQKDPNSPDGSRKGLSQGVFEVQMDQRDPLWKQKLAITMGRATLDQKSKWMDIQHTGKQMDVIDATLAAKKQAQEDERSDATLFAQAQAEAGNDTTKISNSATPAFKSAKYLGMWLKTKDAATKSLSGLATKAQEIAEAKGFEDDMRTLDPATRASIRNIKDPAQKIQALGFAKAAEDQRKKNEAAQTEIDALARGDKETTTITDKGTTKKFTPGTTAQDSAPKTSVLSDNTTLAWMPGGKTIHVIKGSDSKKMTPQQLMSIAKTLSSKDPNKKKIMDAVQGAALEQVGGSEKPTAPSSKTASSKAEPQPWEKNNPYKVGGQYGTLRYKGGDPNKESSWEKVGD